MRRLAGVLDSWNARLRIGRDRGDEGAALPFVLDERSLTEIPILTLTTDQGRIDVMHSVLGVGDYTACKHRSERFDVGDSHFDALDLGALIDSKRASARVKDERHLIELKALRDLERAEPIDRG